VKKTNANPILVSFDTVPLAENLKQLCLKAKIFTEFDDKIIASIEDEEKLEEVVFEADILYQRKWLWLYTFWRHFPTQKRPQLIH